MNDQEPIRQVASSKEEILASLKEHGYRLTEQRKLIVDIIANEEYTCCKEVYFLAHKRDNSIGIATVYRMINTLEEIGAISRKNIQKNNCSGRCCDMKGRLYGRNRGEQADYPDRGGYTGGFEVYHGEKRICECGRDQSCSGKCSNE